MNEALKLKRIECWRKAARSTSVPGVIPIDNVLVDHTGKLIEHEVCLWDHAEQRYKVTHEYLIVNCVCTSRKHYPLSSIASSNVVL